MQQSPILTVTVNPALDLTTGTARLAPQRKLRCAPPHFDPGGGGANVSRAIHALGGESLAFVAVGGATGAQFGQLLAASGVTARFWPLAGETRISMTVMEEETGLHYRFVLPGPDQPPGAAEALLDGIVAAVPAGCRHVVASGGLLPGLPEDFYGRLVLRCRAAGLLTILDTHGAALKAALSARPHIVRFNHLEAQELLGGGDAQVSAQAAGRLLVERGQADIAIVALGENGAMVTTADRQFRIRPPKVAVRSMVGAGDSYVGALTLGLARGWSLEDANRFGVAAAASAVTKEATELCDLATTEALLAQMGPVSAV